MDATNDFYSNSKTVNPLKELCKSKKVKLVLPKRVIRSGLVLVGESLGEQEHIKEEYFVGKAGVRLDLILSKVQLLRQIIHITNVIKVRPPDNKVKRLPELGLKTSDFIPMLKEELEFLKPNIIVVLGGLALFHLTGQHEITKYRGSILPCTLVPGLKVIGAFHPSYAVRNPELNFSIVFDLQKAIEQSVFPEIRMKPFKEHINPTFTESIQFLDKCLESRFLSYDIETAGGRITRLGVAPNDEEGMSIPLKSKGMKNSWSDNDLNTILQRFKKIWKKQGIIKIGQNHISYDCHPLVPLIGFPAGPLFDTEIAHKLLYAVGKESRLAVQHDLGFITSTQTDMPFHKDDHKDWEQKQIPADDSLSSYNIKDVISTLRAAQSMMKTLVKRGLSDFFCGYVMPLQRVLFKMEYEGLKTNNLKRLKMLRMATKESKRIQKKIDKHAGRELNVNSFPQVSKLLYQDLKLPVKKKRGTKKITTDEKALDDLYASTKNPILKLIIRQRFLTAKVLGNYLAKDKLSKKGRLHTSYGIAASGRLTSSENLPLGCGNNLQNIPDELRDFVVPEKGNIFLCPDLSQAEALYVIYESEAKKLREEVILKGEKIHNVVASWIHDKQIKDLTLKEYTIIKNLVHGTNYRMGAYTFARLADVTVAKGRELQAKYARVFPELFEWQEAVIAEGKATRKVTTLYGRTRWFLGRLNEMAAKEMVSHKPQSVVADTLDIGLLGMFLIAPEYVKPKIQIHDEVVLELPPDKVEEFSPYIKAHMETLRAMEIKRDVLCIPVSIPKPRHSWMKPK